MNPLRCLRCGSELGGRRRLYCSDEHGTLGPARHCACGTLIQRRRAIRCRRCSDIARRRPRSARLCRADCGQPAAPRHHYCSDACRIRLGPSSARHQGLLATTRELACARCSTPFTTRKPNRLYCSKLCSRRSTRRPKELRSRSRFRQPTTPVRLSRLRIYERDEWRCWLCDGAVNPELRWPDPRSASLDHVVPLSRGGADDESNLRLAHLDCNAARGAPEVAA